MYSPETQSRIEHLRAKASDGSLTPGELAEGIKLMREGRLTAVTSSAAAKQKKAKVPVNIEAVFAEIDKL